MSIRIHEDRCIGCGRCTEACPGNLLLMQETDAGRKAKIREVRDCWGCTACMKDAPSAPSVTSSAQISAAAAAR